MLAKINHEKSLFPALRDVHDAFSSMFNHLDPFWKSEMMFENEPFAEIELKVDDNEIIASLPLPGCKNSDVSAEIENDILHIRGCREESKESKNKKYIRHERSTHCCEQSVKLPFPVKNDKASAKYTDGILTVTMPRDKADVKTSHVIKVN